MLAYFGATFFSLMKIMNDDNSNTNRKLLLLASYIIFIGNIILPILITWMIFRRFELLSHVNPGALIPNIGHLKQKPVQPCLPDGLTEHGLMSPR